MTVEAMAGLPLQAGSAVAAAAGRTALWAVSLYMQQPLRNTALAMLVGLSALASSNALYHQAHHHPAPLFGSFQEAPAARSKKPAAPVMPAARPKVLDQAVSSETTGSLDPMAALIQPVDNADVIVLQRRLKVLGLFNGTADGLFGPRTARAIKAFEARNGHPVQGQLTQEIVALINGSPLAGPESPAAPASVPNVEAGASANVEVHSVAPLQLPAPAPLLSAEPNQADTQVAEIAPVNDQGVKTVQMTSAPALPTPTKRSVQTIAVRAMPQAADDAPAMPAPITTSTDIATAADPGMVTSGEGTDDESAPEAVASVPDAAAQGPAVDVSTDQKIVAAIQRGLNSLGFLHGAVNGVADEATSKAIRNFEVYFNYDVTGQVSRQLVKMLADNGALI